MEKSTYLRVLYTINSTPQYILARSLAPVPVSLVPAKSPQDAPLYGMVSLTTCLETIRRSSPDLMHDAQKDYVIYVLDPLESQSMPAMNISSTDGTLSSASQASSRGVAVGLGLMSLALGSDEGTVVTVAGTLMMQGNGLEALEVIFALRETTATPQPSRSDSQSSMASTSRPVEPPLRAKLKAKGQKTTRQANTPVPVTESDKLLNAETYIGPKKKPGRPRTNVDKSSDFQPLLVTSGTGSHNPIVVDGSDNEDLGSRLALVDAQRSRLKRAPSQATSSPFSTTPLARKATEPDLSSARTPSSQVVPPPASSTTPQEQQILEVLNTITSSMPMSNAALLATMSSIDSDPNAKEHPNLLAALQTLLSLCTRGPAPSTVAVPPHPSPRQPLAPLADHVRKDKENVNPTVHRKPSEKEFAVLGERRASQSERSLQGLLPSVRSNDSLHPAPKEEPPARLSSSQPRKRTLSDFMDEKETQREKGKQRERRNSSRQTALPPRVSTSYDALKYYPRLVDQPRSEPSNNSYYRTGTEPWTSPPRPSSSKKGENNPTRTFIKPASKPGISASSPPRPTQQRRKYVVPEWARTSTAMHPRLSDEARKALEEAEQAKQQEKRMKKKLSMDRRAKEMQSELQPSKLKRQISLPTIPKSLPPASDDSTPTPTAAACPVVASASIAFPIFASTRPLSPPPPPCSAIPSTPKTPVRRPASADFTTPKALGKSLFTPTMSNGSLFGSGGSSRSPAPPSTILTSPLGNRKKAKISPIKFNLYSRISGFCPPSPLTFSSSKSSVDDESWKEVLAGELESALEEELEMPPPSSSSLPIATSEGEEDSTMRETGTREDGCETPTMESSVSPVKQHWTGLPPSSPPPPSSPSLLPDVQDDDEMDEIPIATSDSETDTDMEALPTEDDFSSVDPMTDTSSSVPTPPQGDYDYVFNLSTSDLGMPTSMDMFEQFTNLNQTPSDDFAAWAGTLSSGLPNDPSVDPMFQGGLGQIDFTEFWESFKPLIGNEHDTSGAAVVPSSDQPDANAFVISDFGSEPVLGPAFGDVTPETIKLAEEVHALFSGCLM